MTSKVILTLPLFLMVVGCAANKAVTPPPQPESPPQQPPAAAPTQPAGSGLKLDLPAGWERSVPPEGTMEGIESVVKNESLQSVILVALYLTKEMSPAENAAMMATTLRKNGVQTTEISIAPDGLSASFDWNNLSNGMAGKMTSIVLKDVPQVSAMFMGVWPGMVESAAAPDFDAVVASAHVSNK